MREIVYRIKNLVTMYDICRQYGITVDKGFCRCLFHNEKTASMKIYKDGYKCYGCGAYGSVVDFVMRYFGLSLYDACVRINEDMRLGLPIGNRKSLRDYRAMQQAVREREKEIYKERAERLRLQENYNSALDYYACCDQDKLAFAPKEGEPISDLYALACKNIDYASYLLDIASLELYEYEHQ